MCRIINIEKPLAASAFLFVILKDERQRKKHKPLMIFYNQILNGEAHGRFQKEKYQAHSQIKTNKGVAARHTVK